MNSPTMFWDGVVRRLQAELSPFVVEAWVRPLIAEGGVEQLRLLCPSALHRDRVRSRFLKRIRELIHVEAGRVVEIELAVVERSTRTADDGDGRQRSEDGERTADRGEASPEAKPIASRRCAAPEHPRERSSRPHEQPDLPYTFENFVVGDCNRLAREASMAVAHGAQESVNPLYLTSASGLGKTHLARAIAAARGRASARVIYTSSETFTNQFTNAIRKK